MTANKQEKKQAIEAAKKRNAARKKDKAVTNLNAYQTQHKNHDVQAKRELTAREEGLPGHASASSSSNQNDATTQRLKKINQKSS